MVDTPYVPLINLGPNCSIPGIGYGTFSANGSGGYRLIREALNKGYRHFDSAQKYQNERIIGELVNRDISDGYLKREDIFITTKLWGTFHGPDNVETAVENSNIEFGLGYIDLLLMHTPMGFRFAGYDDLSTRDARGQLAFSPVDYIQTWTAMEGVARRGLVRGIGLSNFNQEQIRRVLEASEIRPLVNQIEVNPGWHQTELIEYCRSVNMKVIACAPMGRPGSFFDENRSAFGDDDVRRIGAAHRMTEAQVILKYLIQLGTIPIPFTMNADHMRENIHVFDFMDFEFNENEMQTMDSFHSGRSVRYEGYEEHNHYPFERP